MSFASLRSHALIRAAGVATAVVLPLGVTAAIAPAASAVTTQTAVSTAVAPPTAAQVAAAQKVAAAKKVAAKKLAKKRALAKKKARIVARGKKIVKVAAKYKGTPYRYGGNGPSSFDCSGFTRYVVRKALKVSLPRTAAQQKYAKKIKKVSKSNRKVGDLIFFGSGHGISHVGIYAGNGTMWDAPHSGSHVKKHKIWSKNVSYGRIR